MVMRSRRSRGSIMSMRSMMFKGLRRAGVIVVFPCYRAG